MNYKLLIADIDGTIVDHGSRGDEVGLDHPSRLAIQTAMMAGKFVSFATGRNYFKASPVIKAFGLTSPIITTGGAQIVDPNNDEILWERRLDESIAKQICDLYRTLKRDNDTKLGFGHAEERNFNDISDEQFEDVIYLDFIGISPEHDDTIEQIIDFTHTFQDAFATRASSTQFPGRTNLVITNDQATKQYALIELQSILDVSLEETIAIGDGDNDLPLFISSGLKVAVANAGPKLLKEADIVVGSVHEHGIIEIIEKRLLGSSSN